VFARHEDPYQGCLRFVSNSDPSPHGWLDDDVSALSGSAIPILPSGDLTRSAGFLAYLGFATRVQTSDYLQADAAGTELHYYLARGTNPATNQSGCLLRVADPERLRAAWTADGLDCLEVTASETYGRTEFAVCDPDGNLLRIGRVLTEPA
jgi:hypothetical protein